MSIEAIRRFGFVPEIPVGDGRSNNPGLGALQRLRNLILSTANGVIDKRDSILSNGDLADSGKAKALGELWSKTYEVLGGPQATSLISTARDELHRLRDEASALANGTGSKKPDQVELMREQEVRSILYSNRHSTAEVRMAFSRALEEEDWTTMHAILRAPSVKHLLPPDSKQRELSEAEYLAAKYPDMASDLEALRQFLPMVRDELRGAVTELSQMCRQAVPMADRLQEVG